tara:strand:- start:961 stop:1305 length:345 start_codon:yes stop_codon:yes gene_type:complete
MESKAKAMHIRQSPRKIRKSVNNIRGLSVGEALNCLHFSTEKAALIIEKTIRSAISNMLNKQEDLDVDPNSLIVKEAFVNGGPVMKRFRASAMGRVSRRRRPSSHIVIILSDKG